MRKITNEMGISYQEQIVGMIPLINKIVEKYLVMEYAKEKRIDKTDNELETSIKDVKRSLPNENKKIYSSWNE